MGLCDLFAITLYGYCYCLSQGQLQIEYFPLRVGEQSARLELYCPELGVFPYDLELRATPAAPEKTVRFESALGASDTKSGALPELRQTEDRLHLQGMFYLPELFLS